MIRITVLAVIAVVVVVVGGVLAVVAVVVVVVGKFSIRMTESLLVELQQVTLMWVRVRGSPCSRTYISLPRYIHAVE
jgi:hypothetical protein